MRVSQLRKVTQQGFGRGKPVPMRSEVLSVRMDSELLERVRQHATRHGMSVQDYVIRTLVRDDFDQRFKTAVEETEKFYGVT
jgi:hypothetical protein